MTEETKNVPVAEVEKAPETVVHPHDPYPRMIIVCIVIFIVLLIIIFGVLAADFALRRDTSVRLAPTVVVTPQAEDVPVGETISDEE